MFRNISLILCASIVTTATYAQDCGTDKILVFKDGKKDCASNYEKFISRTVAESRGGPRIPVLDFFDGVRRFSWADSGCGFAGWSHNQDDANVSDGRALANCERESRERRSKNSDLWKDCNCQLVVRAERPAKNIVTIALSEKEFSEKYKSSTTPSVGVRAKTEATLASKVPAPAQAFAGAPKPEAIKLEPQIKSANQTNLAVAQSPSIVQSPSKSAAQITSNPIDSRQRTSTNEVWLNLNPSITIQQRQFCRVLENFRVARSNAEATKNEIRINSVYRELSQSLNALMPDGKFQNWILRADSVTQASDGSAEVFLELPCGIYIGSNACDKDPKKFYGTAPEGSMLYTELSKITSNDFVVASGEFFFADSKTFDKGRSVASFRMMRAANHCRAREVPADSDFYGAKISIISTIK